MFSALHFALVLVMFVLSGVVCAVSPGRPPVVPLESIPQPERITILQAALQWRESELQNFSYDLEYILDRVDFDQKTEKRFLYTKYRVMRKGNRNLIISEPLEDKEQQPAWRAGWDGTVDRSLVVTSNRTEGRIEDREFVTMRQLAYNHILGYRTIDEGELLPEWISKAVKDTSSQVSVEEERQNDVLLWRLDVKKSGFVNYRFWFDPSKDFSISKYQYRHADDKTVFSRGDYSVDESKQINGLWIPTKVIRLSGIGRHPNIHGRHVYTVTEFSRGTVKDEDLEVPFPAGTTVVDTVRQNAFKVNPDGSTTMMPLYKPETGTSTIGGVEVSRPPKLVSNPETRPDLGNSVGSASVEVSQSWLTRTTLSAIGAALLGGIAIGWWMKRARNRTGGN